MNYHKDHVASCLCCKYLWCQDASRGYSELTPGSPLEIGCEQGVFEFNEYDVTIFFENLHDLGRECKFYEAKD
jgi:hypothetical protein